MIRKILHQISILKYFQHMKDIHGQVVHALLMVTIRNPSSESINAWAALILYGSRLQEMKKLTKI